jgi:hypothetical protein
LLFSLIGDPANFLFADHTDGISVPHPREAFLRPDGFRGLAHREHQRMRGTVGF